MKNNFGIQRQLQQKRVRRRRVRFFFYLCLAVSCIAAFLYFVFFSGYFLIQKISFYGGEVITAADAEKAMNLVLDEPVFLTLRRRNVFLFSTAAAERALVDYFPRIAAVRVSRKFFTKEIMVTITERQTAGIACGKKENSSCFYFDDSGVLFADAPVITGASVLVIKDDNLPPPAALPFGQYAKEAIAFIRDAKQATRDSAGVTILSFSFTNEYGDIEAVTLGGYAILFSMERDASSQARIVKNILAVEIKEQAEKLDYIDLRVENRVYYKLREQ